MCTNGQLDNTDGVFAPYSYRRILGPLLPDSGSIFDAYLQMALGERLQAFLLNEIQQLQ